MDRLELSQPAVSKHLRVLREAGLVEIRQDAQRRRRYSHPVERVWDALTRPEQVALTRSRASAAWE